MKKAYLFVESTIARWWRLLIVVIAMNFIASDLYTPSWLVVAAMFSVFLSRANKPDRSPTTSYNPGLQILIGALGVCLWYIQFKSETWIDILVGPWSIVPTILLLGMAFVLSGMSLLEVGCMLSIFVAGFWVYNPDISILWQVAFHIALIESAGMLANGVTYTVIPKKE